MHDLTLIAIDDLIVEIESRCETFICAYELPVEKQREGIFNTHKGKGLWLNACALSSVLNNEVINSWGGELKTLQRINKEDNEE